MGPCVRVWKAGLQPYRLSYHIQQLLAKQLLQDSLKANANTLMLVEHSPVYTIGIRTKEYSADEEVKLKNLGADFYRTNRGGLITFHGPGQLVAYPILDLRQFKNKSMRIFIGQVENSVINVCEHFGIAASKSPHTGVWVNNNKICAIGVHGSRFVTTHGLALNCNTDLSWFEHIVPCGIVGKGVTSLSQELGRDVKVEDVIPVFEVCFKREFECDICDMSPGEAVNLLKMADLQICNG